MTAPMTADPHVLTATEVASALRIHPNTVYRRIASGDIPTVPCGRNKRVPRVWLEEHLSGGTVVLPASVVRSGSVALIDAGTFT